MNHRIVIKIPNTENQNHVASNSISKCYATNNKLVAGDNSTSTTDSTNLKMCLRKPKIVLDRNVVAQYFKTKRNTNKGTTSYCNKTKLEGANQILVTSEKCLDHVTNKLSVKNVLSNKSMLVEEKEVILEGPIYSQNNNLFHNINEYITQQSVEISSSQSYSNTQILDNHIYKYQPCNGNEFEDDHNFVNNKNTMFIKGEPVDMECGDDILYTNDNNYYNENVVTKTEPVEMECGDDILFTNGNNHYDEDAVTTLSESTEMECGDDILYANGAGYYSNSDEDSAKANQDFYYSHEDAKTNVLIDECKAKIEIKEAKSPILDTFEEQEEKDKFYHEKECDYKTFIKQELHSHVTSQNSNFLDKDNLAICEKCGRMFENSLLLKEHQFESCGLKYFYTCKFCPSTSWYSSTLKNHIEVVHSRELDKENIDDIMEIINRSKQVENDQSDELNFNKQVLLIQERQKTMNKSAKRKVQTKKKKIYINYNEVKRILNISCFECNKDPEYVRGRTDPYCSQCHNEYTFQCRKCSRFYFKYNSAILHAKGDCKKKISKKTLKDCNQLTKVQGKSPNTLPNSTRKYFTTFCTTCNESLEQNECNNKTACRNCNKTSIQYQCEACKQIFEVKATAKRHSQMCHKKWSEFLIKSSLSTIALLDHNYYCKNKSEPRVKKIAKQIEQAQFTELSLSQHKPAKRVYTGKKSQSYTQS